MWDLTVCTYNLMLTVPQPIRYNGQMERAKRIPTVLKDIDEKTPLDVVVFQELIAPACRKVVLKGMKKAGWKHASKLLSTNPFSASLKIVSGGVMVCSKYPILFEKNLVFRGECEGFDCNACKGAVFCRIAKGQNVFNLIATHLQAWDTPKAKRIRQIQARDCARLLASMNLASDEVVLFAGDFNIDFYTRQKELRRMCEILDMSIAKIEKESPRFTSDPSTNQLMGNDEDIMYATDKYPNGCYEEYMRDGFCPCCPQEWLDYIGHSLSHRVPTSHTMRAIRAKSRESFSMKFNMTTERDSRDVSDHYPVVATSVFSVETPHAAREITCNLQDPPLVSHAWKSTFITAPIVCLIFVILAVTIASFAGRPRRGRRESGSLFAPFPS